MFDDLKADPLASTARPRIPRRRLRRPDEFRDRGTKAACTGIGGCSGCCSCPPVRGGRMMATLQQRSRKYNPDGSKRPSLIKRVTRWNKIPASPVALTPPVAEAVRETLRPDVALPVPPPRSRLARLARRLTWTPALRRCAAEASGPVLLKSTSRSRRCPMSDPVEANRTESSVRLFQNDLLEALTHVHPLVPLLFWGPIAGFLLWRSVTVHELPATGLLRDRRARALRVDAHRILPAPLRVPLPGAKPRRQISRVPVPWRAPCDAARQDRASSCRPRVASCC